MLAPTKKANLGFSRAVLLREKTKYKKSQHRHIWINTSLFCWLVKPSGGSRPTPPLEPTLHTMGLWAWTFRIYWAHLDLLLLDVVFLGGWRVLVTSETGEVLYRHRPYGRWSRRQHGSPVRPGPSTSSTFLFADMPVGLEPICWSRYRWRCRRLEISRSSNASGRRYMLGCRGGTSSEW